MDPIVSGRFCSCCDCNLDEEKKYIVHELLGPLNKKGKASHKEHLTSCCDCAESNMHDWACNELYYRRRDADPFLTYEWRAIEYDTKTGRPLRTLHRKRDGTGECKWIPVKP